jgi:hypothetical protein
MARHSDLSFLRMRRLVSAAVVAAAALQAQAAVAQSANRAGSAAPAELLEMRKAWAAAVRKSDGKGAAALAVLPLQFVGHLHPNTLSRSGYISQVPHWSSLKGCLASEPIKPDRTQPRLGSHSFNCDGHGFFFAEKDGVWRHTGYENSNE